MNDISNEFNRRANRLYVLGKYSEGYLCEIEITPDLVEQAYVNLMGDILRGPGKHVDMYKDIYWNAERRALIKLKTAEFIDATVPMPMKMAS